MGSRLPNVSMLHWAQQKYALVGCGGVCGVCVVCIGTRPPDLRFPGTSPLSPDPPPPDCPFTGPPLHRIAPPPDRPSAGPPKISLFFFSLSPSQFSFFLLSLAGPSGLHTTAREPKRGHFRAPALQKHHQNSTKGPPKREKKERKMWRERKKSAKCWASHPSGPHPSGPHPSGPHPSGPHPSGPHPSGPHPSGPHPSGPHPSGPHPSGPHPSGPHPSGPHPSGPHPSGPHPSGPHPSGPHPSGPHVAPPLCVYVCACGVVFCVCGVLCMWCVSGVVCEWCVSGV